MGAAAAAAALVSTGLAAAQPAPADPVRLKLAQDIVEATGGRAQAEAMTKSMFGSMGKLMSDAMPGADADFVQGFQHDMEAEVSALTPQLLEISTQAYARELTERELTDMLAWVRSPSGQAVAGKTVAIQKDVFAAEGPLLRAMMPRIMQRTVDHVCETSRCTPQQRRAMAQAVAKLTGSAST